MSGQEAAPRSASDEWSNVVMNIDLPFDFRRTKLILGTLEYIAAGGSE